MLDTSKAGSRPFSISSKDRQALLCLFDTTRAQTAQLVSHLTPEDMVLQAMPDASPTRWHLAHTSWFFEEFVLQRFERGFEPYDPDYGYLFNSYYEAVGERWPRDIRGLLSRPGIEDIFRYRQDVEERIFTLAANLSESLWGEAAALIELGVHHEKQHQELLCTDIKAAFALNPLRPAVLPPSDHLTKEQKDIAAPANERWVGFGGGLKEIGHQDEGFGYDNEAPRHKVWLEDFILHGTPVTNGQFLDFIQDGGYRSPSLWLSDGLSWIRENEITHPLYWFKEDGVWMEFTLHGPIPLRSDRILSHVSAYEAFAFAEWARARLPLEAELEIALANAEISDGQFLDPEGFIHPRLAGRDQELGSAFGSVWDWTSSAYSAYPGFRPAEGAIGEYNGKFMSQQLVLKGGSCATPTGHVRASYRNFFPPEARWQFSGIRLARDS